MNPWVATQLVLATLKLCKVIDWSWWLVLIPFWICLSVWVGCWLLVGMLLRLEELRKRNMTPRERAAEACRELARRLGNL